MKIKDICGDIKQRKIILCGEYENVIDFIKQYQSELNIKAVMSEHKKDVKLQPYKDYGLETFKAEEAVLSKELIVICDEVKFGAWAKRLEVYGKKEYKDYISQELVDALIYQKKLLVCMGTQLIEQACRFLGYCVKLQEKYSLIYYPENDLWEGHANRMPEYLHVCRWCDVYIRSSCEKERFLFKIVGKNILKPDCQIITVADYGFTGYFPQMIKDREKYNEFLLRQKERLKLSYETVAFARTDKEIENLCLQKMNVQSITEKLMDENYFSKESVTGFFSEEVRRFKMLESTDNIKLGEFIEQHKEEILCRNLNEWNEPVVSYVTESLLQILELPKLSIDMEKRKAIIEENSGSEIPVYPSVWTALNLKGMKNKKYRVVTYYNTKYMSEEEYIYFWTEYLYKAMELVDLMGVDEDFEERLLELNKNE